MAMVRAILDSGLKGRKLTGEQNTEGATPVAMAIIAGQDSIVEEFFQNKHSKKLLDLSVAIKSTDENLTHLLFSYAPYVHPKFVLKRKDANLKEVLNARDANGDTPLLKLARRDCGLVLHRILESKAVKGRKETINTETKQQE